VIIKMMNNKWFYYIVFFTIFLLSLDYWTSDEIRFGFFNLPYRVYYFIILQFILAAVIYLFSKRFWKESMKRKGDKEID